MKIGDKDEPNERTWSPAKLGFSEVYFQFWIQLNEYRHIVFPLTDEAFLEQGYELVFDKDWKLTSTPIPKMPKRLMRPTAVKVKKQWDGNCELFMIGGTESRCSLKYDTAKREWTWLPKLSPGCPISCNVCVNYRDTAIFVFTVDGKLTIKAAYLPLRNHQEAKHEEEIVQEMEWCLERK